MLELILASASPRRRSLLENLGFRCIVMPQDLDENPLPDEKPEELVKRLALSKASSALAELSDNDDRLVLGSDTIVVCDDRILGKPQDQADAFAMLRLLSGRSHEVLTAVALLDHNKQVETMSASSVSFSVLSDAEIAAYWQSEEPLGKAGGYAVQGLGAMFVSEIRGSYSGVVGLPIFETVNLFKQFGIGIEAILQNQK